MDFSGTTIKDGVMRWAASGAVASPEECAAAKAEGLPVSVARCKEVRVAESAGIPQGLTDDEIAAARRALGMGKSVVDVLSGRRIRL